MKSILALKILLQTTELRKHLLAYHKPQIESRSSTVVDFGEKFIQLVQESHPVNVTMQLFFRTECIKDVIAMMKLFGFVFITIILSWKISNQTFVAFDMFNEVLITSCWFFKKLWDSITANSGNKRMLS